MRRRRDCRTLDIFGAAGVTRGLLPYTTIRRRKANGRGIPTATGTLIRQDQRDELRQTEPPAPVQFATRSGAAWAVLAGIPVGTLRSTSRRAPARSGSQHAALEAEPEDLHVNSSFSLRRNFSCSSNSWLTAMLALAGPRDGHDRSGQRFVLAVDNHSKCRQPISPTAARKAEAKKIIDTMDSYDLAMIISFSDAPKSSRTIRDRRQLLKRPTRSPNPGNDAAFGTPSGRCRIGQSVEQIGEGAVATSVHPQAVHLHGRRLLRCRRIQPGQPEPGWSSSALRRPPISGRRQGEPREKVESSDKGSSLCNAK